MADRPYDELRSVPGLARRPKPLADPLAWNWRLAVVLGLNLTFWLAVFKLAAGAFAG